MMTTPSTTSTTPVARSGLGSGLVGKHGGNARPQQGEHHAQAHTSQSGVPPIIKWDTAPVRAVKVMMNTLVPTAVFSSYPSTLVRMSSIIMPPPAPIKPQMKPMSTPHTTDCTARFAR